MNQYWQLVFGHSLYKKYSSKFNWWVRYNPLPLAFIFLYAVFTAMVFPLISSFGLYVLMTPFIYKVFASVIRRTEKGVPIIKSTKKVDVQTPFHWVNVFFFFTNLIPTTGQYGYEKFTKEELILHKKQQSAKIYFNLFFVILIGIFAFKTHQLIPATTNLISSTIINMETGNNSTSLVFQIIEAVGSIATLGAFLFLFIKDRSKQKQIDELATIAKTLAVQNEANEKRLRLTVQPEFKKTGNKDSGYPDFKNIGETASVMNIVLDPPIGTITAFPFPFDVYKDDKLLYDVTGLQIPNSFGLTCLVVTYRDKAGNTYKLTARHQSQTIERVL